MKNLIFLDIDGVLNCENTFINVHSETGSPAHNPIDIDLLNNFFEIKKYIDFDVVLSSTWRAYDELKEKVKKVGIDFIDITPSYNQSLVRQGEIFGWLAKQKEDYNWIAIDDDIEDMREIQRIGRLFKTNFKTGLTEKIALDIIDYFEKTTT